MRSWRAVPGTSGRFLHQVTLFGSRILPPQCMKTSVEPCLEEGKGRKGRKKAFAPVSFSRGFTGSPGSLSCRNMKRKSLHTCLIFEGCRFPRELNNLRTCLSFEGFAGSPIGHGLGLRGKPNHVLHESLVGGELMKGAELWSPPQFLSSLFAWSLLDD